MIGGDVVVIANCPSCGTHYKHETPAARARARCGRCDTALDLSRLRPYRIVSPRPVDPADIARAARHLPIGLDHPALATTIARNVERSPAPARPIVAYHVADSVPEPRVTAGPPPATASTHGLATALPDTAAPVDRWDENDPLPSIPEMATRGAFEPSVPPVSESDILGESQNDTVDDMAVPDPAGGTTERATTFGLWLAAGAIVGTGVSWTLGGTTTTGLLAGGALGAVTGWGWLRWTSPK